MTPDEFRKKYQILIHDSRQWALKVNKEYTKMSKDLGEFNENFVVSEQAHYIKENEERYKKFLDQIGGDK